MKTFVIFILGAACVAAQTGCVPESEEEEAYREVRSGLEAFAINLYQDVRSGESGNVVVSPLSAFVVLALTSMGAHGRTAQQVGDVLHLSPSRRRVADGFRMLMDSLPTAANQSEGGALLNLANRLYVQSGFNIQDTFMETAVNNFRSGVNKLNFTESENARNLINQWIADKTNKKILDAIPPGAITADTRLILVNTVLFSAKWSHQFDKSATSNQTFHVSKREKVIVPMMHETLLLQYSELPEFNAKALKLPYRSIHSEAYMLIVLPKRMDGMNELEENLGQLDVSRIQSEQRRVNVHLPSFTINMRIPLKQILEQLGVTDLFDLRADLSGISDAHLDVSDVLQKAYIRVDENGTEAAAATVVTVGITSYVPVNQPPIEFKADHPFLYFLIVDEIIIFMGRVVNPKE